MKLHFILPLACALACVPTHAQSPTWSTGAKFGFDTVLTGTEPQNGRAGMHAGFWVERSLTEADAVFGEFSYHYFRAVDHEVTKFGTGYYPAGTGQITVFRSVDTRKDNLEGYGLNLGYRRFMGANLSLHAGLALNSWVSAQEVQGQLSVVNGPTSTATILWKEGMSFVPSTRSTQLGAFVGARYAMTKQAFLEGNIRRMAYKWTNYVPYAYTGQAAHVETESKSKVFAEFSLGIRF